MDKVTVDLENCFGIARLSHTFDFTAQKTYAIYAPNGAMKTSFASTFKCIADNRSPQDRVFKLPSKWSITDENGTTLPRDSVLVLTSYDEGFQQSEQTSTLLVNKDLRELYEKLHRDVDQAKRALLNALKEQSRTKRNLATEISVAFTGSDTEVDFYIALNRISPEVLGEDDAPLSSVPYDVVLNDNVLRFLNEPGVQADLQAYIERYSQLLDGSVFFKRGVFEYYNASQIAKNLEKNCFFQANHTITLRGGKTKVIKSPEEIESLIAAELEQISNDPELKRRFGALKGDIEANATLREFKDYLCVNTHLIPHLGNIPKFRQRLWVEYVRAQKTLYVDLIEKYNQGRLKRGRIEAEAEKESTQWEEAIKVFNQRFFVPFRLEVKNRNAIIFGGEKIPNLGYTYENNAGSVEITRDALLGVLSQGEKKALYILNIIFEIEIRRKNKQETLFIVDDIADSFDYRNKYAIIQYLLDISDGADFKQIILTHNFDFFRTIRNRFQQRECLIATKTVSGIKFNPASGVRNVLMVWKKEFFQNNKRRIAAIPFMRNLIEYIDSSDPGFKKLTDLLHWKPGRTDAITQADLDGIYHNLFKPASKKSHGNPLELVVDMIDAEAVLCLAVPSGPNLEHKVVLAMATRLAAEKFMVGKVGAAFAATITKFQAAVLLKEFKRISTDAGAIGVLDRVVLMTPENIHLNAFMYEPLLDMSDEHLKKLFQDVKALK